MTETKPLLVEVGTEELPVEEQQIARAFLRETLPARFAEVGWSGIEPTVWTTPRRIVIYVKTLPTLQPARTEIIKGPPASVAWDAEGRPTRALEGFLRRYGASIGEVRTVEGPKGAYVILERTIPGKSADALLPDLLTSVLEAIPFRKRMRWPGSSAGFSRPVRWLVALLGDAVLEWTFAGVRAGRISRGHRLRTGDRTVEIPHAAAYEAVMETVFVMPSNEKRRRALEQAVGEALTAWPDRQPVDDPKLIEAWVHLTEWPTVLAGQFDKAFLHLPAEILITTMRHHQKYLAVIDARGILQPMFLTSVQADRIHEETVRTGHERVLTARFRDADFFWREDRRRGLETYARELGRIQFLDHGGTYADKVTRLQAMVDRVASAWGLDDAARRALDQAIRYCKADLASQLVGEFPELEGIVGGLLARDVEWPEEIARAIYEHLRPQRLDDPLPTHPVGRCLAFLDRMDSLLVSFGLGHRPSGSRDPLGQRRWAMGVLRLLIEGGVSLDLPEMARTFYETVHRPALEALAPWETWVEEWETLMKSRLVTYWEARGVEPNWIQSLIDRRPWDPWDLNRRLEAFQRSDPKDVYRIGLVFKRLYAMTREVGITEGVDPARFLQDEERALWAFYERARPEVEKALEQRDYETVIRNLARISPLLHTFFERVFVMVDDAALRTNRLALLGTVRGLFERLADLDRWQVDVTETF